MIMFEFKLPDLGEGIHEGELLAWHVKEGATIKEDDPLCDMETDKATVTIPSPKTGVAVKLNGRPGDTIPVGSVLVVIEEIDDQQGAGKDAALPAGKNSTISDSDQGHFPQKKKVAAAPATRRLAREMGVDITQLTGTGPGKRVTPQDVRSAVSPSAETKEKQMPSIPREVETPVSHTDGQGIPFLQTDPLPDFSAAGPIEKIPIRSLRKKVATKTTTSAILIPHVAHMEEWDVTKLDDLRRTVNQKSEERLTLLSFVVKAVGTLLKEYPEFNASVDHENLLIVQKKYYHIGFAADTPKGLIVPVVPHADQKSVASIAGVIKNLAQKGKDGTIDAKELTGSTFTITNVGVIGGTGVFPIINYPESAILGMGRMTKKPVVKQDQIEIRKMLPATLCFDHRVADGVRAARFMRYLKKRLEDPMVYLTQV